MLDRHRFCTKNTFWYNIKPGYLGAYLHDGFHSDLLFQIASELKIAFPRILGNLDWGNMWGFKHDRQHGGIKVHADTSSVNVNFWITPNTANLNPETGGLQVWDMPPPPDWNFRKLNKDHETIMNYLRENGSQPIRIAHKENRAIMFRADLFHRTDDIEFKEGYLNKRLNITMLYGDRQRL